MEFFTASELLDAQGAGARIHALEETLKVLLGKGPWSEELLLSAAQSEHRKYHLRNIMKDALSNRKHDPEGTLTFDELYEHYKREGFHGVTHFERVKADILAHREPEFPTGTVVRDSSGDGGHYFLTADRRWLGFGSNVRYDYDYPKRPLKVVS